MSPLVFPISFWFELLSFLVSLLLIKRLRSSNLYYFIPLLLTVVLGEFIGAYLKFVLHKNNGWLYNILTLIQFSFWIFLFKQFLKKTIHKKMSFLLLLVFFSFGLLNLFLIQGFRYFNHYTLIVGAFIVVLQCCLYFFQLFNEEGNFKLLKTPMFWIATGAIFFFIGTFFYFSLYGYLRKIQIKWASSIFDLIITNLNIVFYSCISIGLAMAPKKE